MSNFKTSTLSDRYDGTQVQRLWLNPDLAAAFSTPTLSPGDPGVASIIIKAGWFLLIGGAGKQRWVNPDNVAAFEIAGQGGVTL